MQLDHPKPCTFDYSGAKIKSHLTPRTCFVSLVLLSRPHYSSFFKLPFDFVSMAFSLWLFWWKKQTNLHQNTQRPGALNVLVQILEKKKKAKTLHQNNPKARDLDYSGAMHLHNPFQKVSTLRSAHINGCCTLTPQANVEGKK